MTLVQPIKLLTTKVKGVSDWVRQSALQSPTQSSTGPGGGSGKSEGSSSHTSLRGRGEICQRSQGQCTQPTFSISPSLSTIPSFRMGNSLEQAGRTGDLVCPRVAFVSLYRPQDFSLNVVGEFRNSWHRYRQQRCLVYPLASVAQKENARNTFSWTYYAPHSTLSEVGTKGGDPQRPACERGWMGWHPASYAFAQRELNIPRSLGYEIQVA